MKKISEVGVRGYKFNCVNGHRKDDTRETPSYLAVREMKAHGELPGRVKVRP